MISFIAKRVLAAVPTLILLAVGAFSLLYFVPGDPAEQIAGQDRSPEHIEQIRQMLGLNQSYLERLGDWMGGLLHGDLGTSLYTGLPISAELAGRIPVSLSLTLVAILFIVAIALPAGIVAGIRPRSWIDRLVTLLASVGVAIPNFYLGVMLALWFAINLAWLPALGYEPLTDDPKQWFLHLVLPALTLALPAIAEVTRQLRGAIVDTASADFVRTARAKGLPEPRVILKHMLKNALVPPTTVLGVQIAYMFGGTVVVEQVFSLAGIGSYAVDAITSRDFPVIQAIVLLSGVAVIVLNIAVDVAHAYLSPPSRIANGG